MNKLTPTHTLWQGRHDDADGEHALRWHHKVSCAPNITPNAVTLIGYPCDLGIAANHGRTGSANGPDAIRQALANMAWHHQGTVYDRGNIPITSDLASTQSLLATQVYQVFTQQCSPLILGGGHDMAWGCFQGLRNYLLEQDTPPVIGILNFDAHFDLRNDSNGPSSGTPFFQIAQDCYEHNLAFHYMAIGISQLANTRALYERANKLGVNWIEDHKATPSKLNDAYTQLDFFLEEVDALYITIDLDVFSSAIAPGVSAPASCGIGLEFAEALLRYIQHTRTPVLMADIAECNPAFDIDQHTSRLAARLATQLATLLASK